MTVRDRTGRTRYVVFRIEGGPVPRHVAQNALPEGAKLTRFDGEHGIARTRHTETAALIRALTTVTSLGGAAVTLRTIATSGTLEAAARRLPKGAPAAQRAPRPPRAKRTPTPPGRANTLK